MLNPWKVLGVHRKSSDAEIRDAYYAIARRNHPDVTRWEAAHAQLADYGSEEFIQAAAAYALIGTAKARSVLTNDVLYNHKACTGCKGTGCKSKTKGITEKLHIACSACGGAGLIIKEKKDDRVIELRGTSGIGGKGRNKKR